MANTIQPAVSDVGAGAGVQNAAPVARTAKARAKTSANQSFDAAISRAQDSAKEAQAAPRQKDTVSDGDSQRIDSEQNPAAAIAASQQSVQDRSEQQADAADETAATAATADWQAPPTQGVQQELVQQASISEKSSSSALAWKIITSAQRVQGEAAPQADMTADAPPAARDLEGTPPAQDAGEISSQQASRFSLLPQDGAQQAKNRDLLTMLSGQPIKSTPSEGGSAAPAEMLQSRVATPLEAGLSQAGTSTNAAVQTLAQLMPNAGLSLRVVAAQAGAANQQIEATQNTTVQSVGERSAQQADAADETAATAATADWQAPPTQGVQQELVQQASISEKSSSSALAWKIITSAQRVQGEAAPQADMTADAPPAARDLEGTPPAQDAGEISSQQASRFSLLPQDGAQQAKNRDLLTMLSGQPIKSTPSEGGSAAPAEMLQSRVATPLEAGLSQAGTSTNAAVQTLAQLMPNAGLSLRVVAAQAGAANQQIEATQNTTVQSVGERSAQQADAADETAATAATADWQAPPTQGVQQELVQQASISEKSSSSALAWKIITSAQRVQGEAAPQADMTADAPPAARDLEGTPPAQDAGEISSQQASRFSLLPQDGAQQAKNRDLLTMLSGQPIKSTPSEGGSAAPAEMLQSRVATPLEAGLSQAGTSTNAAVQTLAQLMPNAGLSLRVVAAQAGAANQQIEATQNTTVQSVGERSAQQAVLPAATTGAAEQTASFSAAQQGDALLWTGQDADHAAAASRDASGTGTAAGQPQAVQSALPQQQMGQDMQQEAGARDQRQQPVILAEPRAEGNPLDSEQTGEAAQTAQLTPQPQSTQSAAHAHSIAPFQQAMHESVIGTAQADTSGANTAPQTDYDIPRQIVDQARLIRRAADTEMVIKLKPEHLGELTLKISVTESGAVSASFHSPHAEVRTAIENSLVQLRQDLSNQGIKVDSVEVFSGLGSELPQGQGQQAYQNQQGHAGGGAQGSPGMDAESYAEEADALAAAGMQAAGGADAQGVDYRI